MAARNAHPPLQYHRPLDEDDRQELIDYLEPDQLVADTMVPVPPAALSGATRAGLWALRLFAIVVSAMVIYTFLAQLG